MADADGRSVRELGRPWQFSLRQLMLAAGIACVLTGFYSWVGLWTYPIAGLLASGAILLVFGGRWFPLATAVFLASLVLPGLLLPMLGQSDRYYRRDRCCNNLRNIGMALHVYHEFYGSFPPAYVADSAGKPMHSWRVLLLPFLEQRNLYERYDFNEPWDGPNNRALAAEVGKLHTFDCSGTSNPGECGYLAVVGPQTMWPDEKSTKFSDIKDGTSKTLMVVEVHNSGIHWMEPRDLRFDQIPLAVNSVVGIGISSNHDLNNGGLRTCAPVLFADGHVTLLPNNVPPQNLQSLLTISGGEKVRDY